MDELTKAIFRESKKRLSKLGYEFTDEEFDKKYVPSITCEKRTSGEFWYIFQGEDLVGFDPLKKVILRIIA